MRNSIPFIILCFSLSACAIPTDVVERLSDIAEPAPEVQLDVPFTSQAPHANWDDPYQEACEEASVLMVHHFLNETDMDTNTADAELLELIEWQTDQGYGQDVSVKEIVEIVEEFYGYKSHILENPSIEEIQMELQNGNPVIVPAAGRMLKNKYFSGEGPWYHMLVITGYTKDSFITNDPGTRRGENFSYKKSVIMNAIHDWTGVKEEIEKGEKRVLVLTSSSSSMQSSP